MRLLLAAIAATTASAGSTTTPTRTPSPTPAPTPSSTPSPMPSAYPECDAGFTCPSDGTPVCGSDGFTYESECALLVSACIFPWIGKVSDGECPTPAPIPRPTPACGPGITCPPDEEPVCGSDGITYTNRCVFSVAMCADPSLEFVADGWCFFMIAPTPKPSCEDGYACQPVRDPVCGSDGKTYNNKCELNVAQCKSDSLVIAGGGPCTSNAFDCSSTCLTTQDFVCGSDGKTYDNECFLQRAKYCSPGDTSLAVVSKRTCSKTPVDETNGSGTAIRPETSSPPRTPSPSPSQISCVAIVCESEKSPVCGSDGKTYANKCELKRAQCSNSKLTLAATESCSSTPSSSTVGKDADDRDFRASGSGSSSSTSRGSGVPSTSSSSPTGSSSPSLAFTDSSSSTGNSFSSSTGSSSSSPTGKASPSLNGVTSSSSGSPTSSGSSSSSASTSAASGAHFGTVGLFWSVLAVAILS